MSSNTFWRYAVIPRVAAVKTYIYTDKSFYHCVEPGDLWWHAEEREITKGSHWLFRWATVEKQGCCNAQNFVTEQQAHDWCAAQVAARAKEQSVKKQVVQAQRDLPDPTVYVVDIAELEKIMRRARLGQDN